MQESPARILIPFFTPVPLTRGRKDGWTPARQRIFIAALQATGVVAKAAKAAGMSAVSAYKLRKREGAESFAAAWKQVEAEAREAALAYAIEHLINGTVSPRFYGGRYVGTAHRFDHRLALAALRAADAMPPPRHGKE